MVETKQSESLLYIIVREKISHVILIVVGTCKN